jgi:hypothetical protein
VGAKAGLNAVGKTGVAHAGNGNTIPLSFQEVEAPRFQDNWHINVVRLSTLRTGGRQVRTFKTNLQPISSVYPAYCSFISSAFTYLTFFAQFVNTVV